LYAFTEALGTLILKFALVEGNESIITVRDGKTGGVVALTVTVVNASQAIKTFAPMLERVDGNVILVSSGSPANAMSSIIVTPSGIVTVTSLKQS